MITIIEESNFLGPSVLLLFKWFNQVCSDAQSQPEELNESDDTHSDAKSKQTSDGREEVDPSLTGVCLVFKNRRSLKVDLQYGDVFLKSIISSGLKRVSWIKFLLLFVSYN